MSSYDDALAILQKATEFGIEASLESFRKFCHFLGDPQDKFPSIQIAGTNGKTSTSRYTAALLNTAGYHTGLYTSPELMEYPERFELDGRVISHELFAEVIIDIWQKSQEAIAAGVIQFITEFEILTAAAFQLFADQQVDWAVLEVGLGGLWDATSAVRPKVAVVTGIDLEHTKLLGGTVAEIAIQKAAIIKPGCQAILGPGTAETRNVFIGRCHTMNVPYRLVEPPYPAFNYIGPDYQIINIATARAAVEAALGRELSADLVQRALDDLVIPGRFEVLRSEPLLMIDAAHNPQAARYLREALIQRFGLVADASGQERVRGLDTLVLGILSDKDRRGILEALTPLFGQLVVTKSASPRSIPVADLAAEVEQIDGRRPTSYATLAAAMRALDKSGVRYLVTGSITMAGEAKALFTGLRRE